jgi:hypothetical protein
VEGNVKWQEQRSEQDIYKCTMVEYFTNNSFQLLQSVKEYLRRELKIPKYSLIFESSEEFKQEDFEKETD